MADVDDKEKAEKLAAAKKRVCGLDQSRATRAKHVHSSRS